MVKPCRSSVRRVMESSAAKGTPPVIIVPSTQCGFIIGKGGCKMKEIMKVDMDMQPNSTERAVNIAVTPDVCPTDLCGHVGGLGFYSHPYCHNSLHCRRTGQY
ncbi:poly(rC)-binding protein 1-like isoform X2 [Paramisgurnus dabryanus]|uniref:poly(rC)-binding protein 1-like isoform X2 n=1 Tax=Paramisgurnus dabryanus TaxID=90735 RepID=UPI0031F38E3A